MGLIKTISERCKLCYTCVRDCPAKAIRVQKGQAEVVDERCIGCGNCILVCTQNAKLSMDSTAGMLSILKKYKNTVALVAPSFPGSFDECTSKQFVGILKHLGFNHVCEVAFGADIVAHEYNDLIKKSSNNGYIATTCPGIVSYVEKYHSGLIKNLAPIVSPMIASGKAVKMIYGKDAKTVFIGPCFAKKEEAARYSNDEIPPIDEVITFMELKELIKNTELNVHRVKEYNFDPPKPGLGALFPLKGGMLQAAEMNVNLLNSSILIADGKENFVKAVAEFELETYDSKLLEILCCRGCIMGAGMKSDAPYFKRKAAVSKYVGSSYSIEDSLNSLKIYKKLKDEGLDLTAKFKKNETIISIPDRKKISEILVQLGKDSPEDELNCRACGYNTCREHAAAIQYGLAESEMCLPYTIEKLKDSLSDLNISNTKLKKTKEALFEAEKLASMGQLSAGIAHEINNPLGVILLNATILLEEMQSIDSLKEYREDIELIVEQSKRCKNIVAGLLNFARKNSIDKNEVNIKFLLEDCLKSIVIPKEIEINITFEMKNFTVCIDAYKITQVLVNLIANSIDAITGFGKIKICCYDTEENITITVADNGSGIPEKYLNKVFEPMFTTKQMGKGTGLGLAVTYGIIKMHKGKIEVKSNAEISNGPTWTKFTITLPRI